MDYVISLVNNFYKMTVLKYYIEEKFNPVPITFLAKNVKLHFEKKKKILLKIT